jgi:dihydrolipoamide dehydrogenase
MAEIIIMPKLGFNMSEGRLVQWHKAEGDTVSKGQPLFSIETDKTTMEIEATGDGVLRKRFIEEGDISPVTLPIAIVAEADEDIAATEAEALSQLGREGSGTAEADATPPPSVTTAYDYHIAIIGGGPGGYVAAIKAAQMGKKAVIVEKERFGGTCLNVGCIPTKTLLRSAEVLREVKESARFGVVGPDVAKAELDLKKVQARKKDIVSQLVGGVEGLLKKNGVTIERGQGVLKDSHTIVIGEKKLTAENIIIATGSNAKNLPIAIDKKADIRTSKELLDMERAPKSIAVIGGGVIGIEFAFFLATIGVGVTVIEFLDQILPMVDEEITDQVAKQLQNLGVAIHTGAQVTEITEKAVIFIKEGKKQKATAEQVLMAVGRTPDLTGIDTEKLGIKTEKGAILTDDTLKTSLDHVYAIGDANGKSMLAHTASMEGIVAVENICGNKRTMDYTKIPSAVYLQPEIASIGLTEKQAAKAYGSIKVGKFPLMANGKAKVAGEEGGLAKVIAEAKYGEIVGVHLYCAHATDMIAEASVAMNLESTAEEVALSVHPHPTISEVLQEAMHAVDGKPIHF